MSRGKRAIVWAVVLLVAVGAGFGIGALTYEPPDPNLEGDVPAEQVEPVSSPTPVDGLQTFSPTRER